MGSTTGAHGKLPNPGRCVGGGEELVETLKNESPVKSGTRGPWASIPHGKEADETRGQRPCVFRETGASGRL